MKRALITGITGQDGSYLAELLLEKGYEVHGMVRRASTEKFDRIEHLRDRITLHQGDLLDQRSLTDTLRACEARRDLQPRRDVVRRRVVDPADADGGVHRRRRHADARGDARGVPEARFYQASSSEMFGKVREVPQTEKTPFYPRSPYGVAKAYGHFITVNYRESYDLHATSGILFNHECVNGTTPLMVRENGIGLGQEPAPTSCRSAARARRRRPSRPMAWSRSGTARTGRRSAPSPRPAGADRPRSPDPLDRGPRRDRRGDRAPSRCSTPTTTSCARTPSNRPVSSSSRRPCRPSRGGAR